MTYDAIVVGGGIVGLATASSLQTRHPRWKIVVLEKEREIARHQTGNNSGVIHSGIYYRPGSLKARLCVEGGRELIEFCRAHEVPHAITGKVIVATKEAEVPRLKEIHERGVANGIQGLRMLDRRGLQTIEPNASGTTALHVPGTGVVDFKRVSAALAGQIREHGNEVECGERVTNIHESTSGEVVVRSLRSERVGRFVVTCGGLQSDRLARLTDPAVGIRILPFRGEYFSVRQDRADIVRGLIYPVPDPEFPFLGVHFTRTVDGGLEVGPNAVLAFKREGYSRWDLSVTDLTEVLTWPGFRIVAKKYWRTGIGEFYRSFSKRAFVRALKRLVPAIEEVDLRSGGSGVRAQACDRTGGLLDDFRIVHHGKILHVCNAPSPAATASLAIGRYIAGLVEGGQP